MLGNIPGFRFGNIFEHYHFEKYPYEPWMLSPIDPMMAPLQDTMIWWETHDQFLNKHLCSPRCWQVQWPSNSLAGWLWDWIRSRSNMLRGQCLRSQHHWLWSPKFTFKLQCQPIVAIKGRSERFFTGPTACSTLQIGKKMIHEPVLILVWLHKKGFHLEDLFHFPTWKKNNNVDGF